MIKTYIRKVDNEIPFQPIVPIFVWENVITKHQIQIIDNEPSLQNQNVVKFSWENGPKTFFDWEQERKYTTSRELYR
jgi:hypothetical protein